MEGLFASQFIITRFLRLTLSESYQGDLSMNECGDLISCAFLVMPGIFNALFALIAAASAIAALTPTPVDDTWVAKVYRIVDAIALNVGYAKEKPGVAGGRFVPD